MKFSSAIEDILEIILSYLPVEDVNTLPLVREQWHEEMWKSLLHRKKYLLFNEQYYEAGGEKESARDRYRTLFWSNYEMINRIEWMVKAWNVSGENANCHKSLTEYSHGTIITSGYIHNLYMSSLDVETDGSIIAVDDSKIVGEASEFYLTCFEIHQGRGLQKSVNVRATPNPPLPRYAKQYYRAISCDDDVICCVFTIDAIAKKVTVFNRDDLCRIWKESGFFPLNAEVVDVTEMQTFDMNEKFHQYYCEKNAAILSGGLQTYLKVGGRLNDLALSIENICACGGGLFFFYGRVVLCKKQSSYNKQLSYNPYRHIDNSKDDIERVVGLFSIPETSISFMAPAPWKYLKSETKYQPKNSQLTTKIVCRAGFEEDTEDDIVNDEDYDVIMFDLNREDRRVVSTSLKNEIQNSVIGNQERNEYDSNSRHIGPFVVADHEIIIAEVCSSCEVDDWCGIEFINQEHKIALSFVPLQSNPLLGSRGLVIPTIDLKATVEYFPPHISCHLTIYSMEGSGDHLILMYGCNEEHLEDEWYSKSVGIVVVHIPTRKEVYSSKVDDVHSNYEERSLKVPRLMTYTQNGELIISFLNNDGMIMTTRSIRTTSTSHHT